ncbi:heterokaryon incompatibility protein-domain-containing protein, partial [Lineolata rhizophorae]
MLCEKCESFWDAAGEVDWTRQTRRNRIRFTHKLHDEVESLKQSAKARCQPCKMIYHGLVELPRKHAEELPNGVGSGAIVVALEMPRKKTVCKDVRTQKEFLAFFEDQPDPPPVQERGQKHRNAPVEQHTDDNREDSVLGASQNSAHASSHSESSSNTNASGGSDPESSGHSSGDGSNTSRSIQSGSCDEDQLASPDSSTPSDHDLFLHPFPTGTTAVDSAYPKSSVDFLSTHPRPSLDVRSVRTQSLRRLRGYRPSFCGLTIPVDFDNPEGRTKKLLAQFEEIDDLSTGSACSFYLAEFWLKKCTTEHEKCRQLDGPKPLPTRVIDVGPADQSRDPYLFETRGATGKYLALSHCWGTDERAVPTTETHNLRDRRFGISFDSLPPTFQDAIKVCRRFSIRYLWVDSLCVIQDSPKDWDVETSRMASVYSNAFFTIEASHGTSPQDGLFVRRDASFSRPCIIRPSGTLVPFWAVTPDDYPIMLRWPQHCTALSYYGRPVPAEEGPSKHRALHEPLESRAWALQEKLLSRRTLTYGANEIRWSCIEGANSSEHDPERSPKQPFPSHVGTTNTIIPDGTDTLAQAIHQLIRIPRLTETRTLAERLLKRHADSGARVLSESAAGIVRHRLLAEWVRVVEAYSARALGQPARDRLAGLAGVSSA